ncbi:MAG: sulfopyruvate decarboxylase subunit beta [Desulfobacteraceae bacterium]|nr:MAG: sulfopyruvate decarboxylase subunit beta [Desulfobacteraceae bacterium]
MNRLEAIRAIMAGLTGPELVVHANGAMGRESFACADRKENFYLVGSMGLAASVGLGVALSRPERKVWVLDGDGNILMGLGNLALMGALKPINLTHWVLDNGVYGTTGNQRTLSPELALDAMAAACGYATAQVVRTAEELFQALQNCKTNSGPHFVQIKISSETPPACPRIPYSAQEIADRFRNSML